MKRIYLLILISLLIRIIIFLTYSPIKYNDSYVYDITAKTILKIDTVYKYDGFRTPVYPAILCLGGFRWNRVWLIQLFMGILISVLMYLITFKITRKEKFSFWVGISYNLSLVLLFFESDMLSETPCILFLLAAIYYLVKIIYEEKKIIYYVLLSLMLALNVLDRQVYLFLFPIIFLFLFYKDFKKWVFLKNAINKMLSYSIPFLVIILSWSMYNKVVLNYFGISTVSGYSLFEHCGRFLESNTFENAPKEYREYYNLFLKLRDKHFQRVGSYFGTTEDMFFEWQKTQNISKTDFSKQLSGPAIWLILHNPLLYLKNVGHCIFYFWYSNTSIDNQYWEYWDLEKIHPVFLRKLAGFYVNFEVYVLWIIIDLIFFAFFFIDFFKAYKKADEKLFYLLTLLNVSIIASSVLQALVAYGDNWRYSIPVKPLILISVLLNFYYLYEERKIKRNILI